MLNLKSFVYRLKSSFSSLTTGLKPPPVTSIGNGISKATELSTLPILQSEEKCTQPQLEAIKRWLAICRV